MQEKILSTLNIHKLTKDQYNKQVSSGNVDEYALYLTPDEEIDLSPYATVEEMNKKANSSDLTSHTGNKSNPHSVTKDQVGLSNVPNVTTNDQTPTYSDTTTFATLTSGEKLSVAFPKIKLAITSLINHIANNTNPHGVTKSQVGLGNVDNTSDKNKPISTATQTALNNKSDVGHTHTVDSAFSTTSTNPVQNKIVTAKVNSLQTSVDSKASSARKINGKALTDDITLSASDVGADASGTANSAVNTHNTSTSAHSDIRTLITNLTTRLNTLADSDDTTLDQMSELVAYIKANRSLIESVTTSKVNVSDIINNLTTNVTNKPLSAAQGVAIKSLIDALQTTVNGKANSSHTHTIANITGLQSTLDGKASTGHTHDLSTMINTLSTETTTPVDADYYVVQHASGGNTTTTYHRKPMSSLWSWIKAKLATVATSGSYNDLTNKPTIGNGTITVTQGGTTKGTFTLNQTGNTTVALTDTNTWRGIQNNLTSTSTTDSLSAAQGKVLNDKFGSYLPLSGGTLTGNLTGQYLTGTWLQTTATSNLTSAASKIAVIDGSGWVYYRTPAQILSDIGGAANSVATQSANGLLSSSDKTKLDGIATGANKYTHPSYTAKSSGLYKVTVDATGHVSAATAVTKADITALGIPASDTNTDTKVTNTLATTTKAYVTGTTSASTNTGTQVFDTGVYLDTTEGRLHVDSLAIGSGVVTYDSTNKCIVITP